MEVTQVQVAAFRLRRQHLAGRGDADVVEICRATCGMQAQVMSAAEMQLWARNHSLARAGIWAALCHQRTLVKTSCMRGTLHLLTASDFPVYMTALRRGRLAEMRRVMARYGVTAGESDRVTAAVVDTLGAGQLSRRDLTERVFALGVIDKKARPWFESSWWGVVRQAIVEGLVCYGPERGRDVTLVRVEQWLPKSGIIDEHEAKQILLRRYLNAYAPASARDFARWAGIPGADAKVVWDSLAGELLEVSVAGKRFAILRADQKLLKSAALKEPVVRLLPTFDPYLLGHADKNHLLDERNYKRVFRSAGWISPVVLVDGRIAGTWSLQKREFQVQLFEKLSPALRKRMEAEAASLSRFL